MLVIILYYVNWVKWTSSLNTYERFISLDKPELNIINFNKNDESSDESSKNEKSSEESRRPTYGRSVSDKEHIFLDSNHSYASLEAINSSLSNSSFNFRFHNRENGKQTNANLPSQPDDTASFGIDSFADESPKQTEIKSKANSETNAYSNRRPVIKPTKATSLQSLYKVTEYNSISLQKNDLSNGQIDLIDHRILEDSQAKDVSRDLDQQEQKIISKSSVHSIQVLSSKHKVEVKIDNQMVS